MSRKSLNRGNQSHKADAGQSQKTCCEDGDSIDGKEDPGEGRDCVEDPKAKQAEAGMNQGLYQKSQRKQQGTDQQDGQNGRQ